MFFSKCYTMLVDYQMASRGRPRTFDREQALRSALEVFWARGYDGATLEELLEAMGGIAPPSFYSAFGSKDRLFREAVDLYYAGMSKVMGVALEAPTARGAIERLLHTAVDQFGGSDGPRGCLIVLGATNATRGNKAAHDHLKSLRNEAPDIIRARLARGVKDGDVPAGAPIADMALFFTTVLHGMAIRARDNGSRQVLTTIADAAMTAWDPLVGRKTVSSAKGAPRRRRS